MADISGKIGVLAGNLWQAGGPRIGAPGGNLWNAAAYPTKVVTPPVEASKTLVDPITVQAKKAIDNKAVQINASPWGNAIPVSMGARAVVGKIIWSSDLREVPQQEVQSADATQPDPQYEVDLAVSFGFPGVDPQYRAATTLISLWAQQVLCYSLTDTDLTAAFNGLQVTFHQGLVDAQPDPLIMLDKGDLTPAWRNQIYVVIKSFPLWKVGLSDGLPDFVAEMFDSLTTGPTITNYTMKSPALSGTPHLYSSSPLIFDAKRNVYYAFIINVDGSTSVGTYDPVTRTEISRKVIAGYGTIYQALDPSVLVVYDHINNFCLVDELTGNSKPVHIVDPASATVLSSLGRDSNSLSDHKNANPSLVDLVMCSHGDTVQAYRQGLPFYGFVLGSFFDTFSLVQYKYDGSFMQLADFRDFGDGGLGGSNNISSVVGYPIGSRKQYNLQANNYGNLFNNINPTKQQDAFAFASHGPKVTMMRIGLDLPAGATTANEALMAIRSVVDVAFFAGGQVIALWVDPTDYGLVVFWHPTDSTDGNVTYIAKIPITLDLVSDPAHGFTPLVGTPSYNVLLPGGIGADFIHEDLREQKFLAGRLGYINPLGHFQEVDTSSGQVTRSTAIPLDPGAFVYDPKAGSFEYINRGTGFVQHVQLYGASDLPIPLSSIISSYMTGVGYDPSQFTIDVSIDDVALGSMIDQSADLWSTMANLAIAYDFMYFTSGGVIKFTKPKLTDDAPAFTVDIDSLSGNTSDPYDSLHNTFASPDEMPGNTGITFIDAEQHYVSNTQTFRRTNFPVVVADSKNDTTVPIPIVMTSAEALRRSGMATFNQVGKSEAIAFSLPVAFIGAEPSDIIAVSSGPYSYNVLIGEVVFDTDWSLAITGTNRNVRVSNRWRVGPDGNWISPGGPPFIVTPEPPPAKPVSTSPTEPMLADMPLLTPADDVGLGFASILCGAVSQVKEGWTGATVSTEVGTDPWQTLLTATKYVPIGRLAGILPDTSIPFQTDTATTLSVIPLNFDPTVVQSVSDADFRGGKNAMIVGTIGNYELIYFRDVSVVDGLLLLNGITRGCRGTDDFTGTHTASDLVYFLSLAGTRQQVVAQLVDIARLGEAFSERARGQSFSGNVTTLQAPVQAQSLYPWAPCRAKAVFATGNDLALTWTRRDRLGTQFVTNPQPMSESSERYDLEILNGSVIVRTVSGLTTPAYTYTAANQSTDGFSPPLSSLHVHIYQLGSVGRGFVRDTTITVGA